MRTDLQKALLAALSALPETERLSAYVASNLWEWPEQLGAFKPAGWSELPQAQKFRALEYQQLIKTLNTTTSEFMRSRQWWLKTPHTLGTEEEHLAWWIESNH
jgi:hypothetical protein